MPQLTAPLRGITVVSVEQAVAAPFATRQLADLGARVIKVERPGGGDFARGYDATVRGQSSYFVWLNRSKQSLSLDIKAAAGAEVLAGLIARADVFVQNLAPGAAARLGITAAELVERHPRLVACDVTGYASDGPYADRRAYDLLIQAESALLSVTGSPEAPARVGASVADIAGGMYALSGILTALYARERTGAGAALEVSLFEALTEWMSQPMYYAMYAGVPPPRIGTHHATIAPYGPYATADGSVLFSIQNEREWGRLCTDVLAAPGLASDPRFASNVARVAHRGELQDEIERVFRTRSTEQVTAHLNAARIASGAANTVLDLLEHPQLAPGWTEIGTPNGPIRALRPPVRSGNGEPQLGAVPAPGEHTDQILAELGLDPAAITALRAEGVIGTGSDT